MHFFYFYQYPIHPTNQEYDRTYPPVNVSIFSNSVKTSHQLLKQFDSLLDHLENAGFSRKIMAAAQIGNQAEVDRLIKSINLKVPVTTKFTPSGVIFQLMAQTSQQNPATCCTLSLTMKWGT